MNAAAGPERDDSDVGGAGAAESAGMASTSGDEPLPGNDRWFSTELSATLIAAEYRAIDQALRPAAPVVQSFDPTPYPAEALARARAFWLDMLRNEYESAAVLVDLAVQLRAINATIDVQTVALRMAQDELRHAAICWRVVEALGGAARIPAPPAPPPAVHEGCSPDEGVLRTVIVACCLSEMSSVVRLMKRHAATSDPFIRDAVRLLLADERLHAQFGFQYLESRWAWIAERPDVRRRIGST